MMRAMSDADLIASVPRARPLSVFLILGALSMLSPFAIDMYLAALLQMAQDFHTTGAIASLSISSYFIGLAFGQVFYGPLLDRYGRKRPIYFGVSVFIAASIGCILVTDIRVLIGLRLLQALGGCVAQVGAVVMVRDFYPADKSAKMYSLVFLMIGFSPLLAPSIGSAIMLVVGWKWIFAVLAAMGAVLLGLVAAFLPEGHSPDPTIRLSPRPIAASFLSIVEIAQFRTYAIAGAFSFAGLFTYVAGSPIVFMDGFGVTPRTYGLIFATLTMGFIGGNQLNVLMLRYYRSAQIFRVAIAVQAAVGIVFVAGNYFGLYNFTATLVMFFVFLSCIGLTNPNAAALALAPFTRNAGSASALLGFFQLGIGALISTGIGIVNSHASLPIILIMAVTAVIGVCILILGRVSPTI